jgi:hypothetical protein
MSPSKEPAMAPRPSATVLKVTVLVLLAGGGVAQGLLTDRWGASAQQMSAALERVPMTIGDWDGTTSTADDDQLPQAEEGGTLLRRYVNRVTGSVVTLFLAAGRPGPMVAEHHPESCYPGAGFHAETPPTRWTLTGPDGRGHEFMQVTWSKTERASPVHLRMYWAWTATGEWKVPDNPRLVFAKYRRLYKVYVIRQAVSSREPWEGDAARAFLQALLPELKPIVTEG